MEKRMPKNVDVTAGVCATASAVALGNFDGVHLGHRAVLGAAAGKRVQGLEPYALSFSPHPLAVLQGRAPTVLCEGRIRERLFADCGVTLQELDFYALKDMHAEDFFYDILLGRFGARCIACGYNYNFGKNGKGNTALLRRLCDENGVELVVAEAVRLDGRNVSSSAIRHLLKKGDIVLANRMLGREFAYDFLVLHGDKIGRTLDFPTINQLFPEGYTVPRHGVYAARAFAQGAWYDAVTNVGTRPTVGGGTQARSETFLFDYEGDLYGQAVEVRLCAFLRPEEKFSSLDALREQMCLDLVEAKRVLAEMRTEGTVFDL